VIQLDTHVVAWLYDAKLDLFRPETMDLMRNDTVAVSPMVDLELQYLHELGRLRAPADVILENLRATFGVETATAPFHDVVQYAKEIGWTRDPFDRIIVAQAIAMGATLVTRDRTILANCDAALW